MKRIILLTLIAMVLIASIAANTSKANVMLPPDNADQIDVDVNILRSIIIQELQVEKEVIQYCDTKVKIGMAAYFRRENGDSEEEVIQTVEDSAKKIRARGGRVFKPLYMESLRMTHDVFRHKEYDHNDAFNRFYRECVDLRF